MEKKVRNIKKKKGGQFFPEVSSMDLGFSPIMIAFPKLFCSISLQLFLRERFIKK
jgi:hypothetical protein